MRKLDFRLRQLAVLAVAAGLWASGFPVLAIILAAAIPGFYLMLAFSNTVKPGNSPEVSAEVKRFHDSLFIADLHTDAGLWRRNFLRRSKWCHLDLPRLKEGGVGLFMCAMPTRRSAHRKLSWFFGADILMWNQVLQLNPVSAIFSAKSRALLQKQHMENWIKASEGALVGIKTQEDLLRLEERRSAGEGVRGVMFAIEGAHSVTTEEDVVELAEAGVRTIGLVHFNDNRYGSSAHGNIQGGLTDEGREFVKKLDRMGLVLDLAHAAEKVIDDVLAMLENGEISRPVIVSHTGLRGCHDHHRNIADEQAVRVAKNGGIIGIGFFAPALRECTIESLVVTIAHAVSLMNDAGLNGPEHVAIGSDFDGAVQTMIDTSSMVQVTAELMKPHYGLSQEAIRLIAGENLRRFYLNALPSENESVKSPRP
ncbi:MAG: membrane dipeptidase [Verrucomicrobiota bacterium]